jgi:MOSC domain-containing protein YiiM
MRIKALYSYGPSGIAQSQQTLKLTQQGIAGNRPCSPWRQVLLLPERVLRQFKLEPTMLRENILLEGDKDIHELTSGSVISARGVELRLTFHCEPCNKLRPLLTPSTLMHQRGYLAQVVYSGVLNLGDELRIQPPRFEPIPYSAQARIRWYLKKLQHPIMAAQLVEAIGLPKSYCRALPALLRNHPDLDASLVRFASRRN